MKLLQKFWYASAPIDLEHKQYILLDFLQSVKDDFTLDVLYPWLSEVQKQYADLVALKHDREEMMNRFKKIKRFNFETMDLEYEYDRSWITKDFEEVNKIVDYSVPMFKEWMEKGQKFFDDVSSQMEWNIVGIVPSYKEEGYFFLHVDGKELFVYRFKLEKIIQDTENYIGLTTEMVDYVKTGLSNYESIKHDLMKRFDLSFPFTLSIKTKSFPMRETLLPVMKRNGIIKIKNNF